MFATMADVSIREMLETDGPAVLRIYQEGIDGGQATFQAGAPDWAAWSAGHLAAGRLVAESQGPWESGTEEAILGWAALSPVSARPVYAGIAEVSIYVAETAHGRGVGNRLLAALIEASEAAGIWTLQAGSFPENDASIALHQRHGFRVLGTRERPGRMSHGPFAGRWRDVILLERRSTKTGLD